MSHSEFTLADLRRILIEGAGVDAGVDLGGDIADRTFDALGYESLALLETVGRIEREYGVSLPDSIIVDVRTPAELIETVNAQITTIGAGA
jgi:act minimal PKS acyl carrier protein